MKRSFLCLALSATLAPGFTAQGQTAFDPATIVEDEDTSGAFRDLVPMFPAHANAYSHGNMIINGVPGDLYVYTWDSGPNLYPNYGFAVRQYAVGDPVTNATAPVYEDYRALSNGWPAPSADLLPSSIDAVILEYNGDPYILICYYGMGFSSGDRDFFMDLYQWTGAGGLDQVNGYPMQIAVAVPTGDKGRYRLSVTDLAGRQMFRLHGSIAMINQKLIKEARQLPVGNYIVQVSSEGGDLDKTDKLVKIK